MTTTRGDYHHFHWLTRAQFTDISGNLDSDDLYFISDENVFYKGSQRMSDPVEVIGGAFPPASKAQGRIYVSSATMEARVWDGSAWVVIAKGYTSALSDQSTDDQVPTAAAVVNYVTTVVGQAEIGGSSTIRPPVQDLAGLVAITGDDLVDKLLCLVEDSGGLFRYDAQSIAAVDGKKVLKPISDDGRWIMLLSTISINGGDFEWNETGQLTLRDIATSKITNLQEFVEGIAGASAVQWYGAMPAVTAEDNGKVGIFSGTTDQTHTQGHVYKVVGGAWADITPTPTLNATDLVFPDGTVAGDILIYRNNQVTKENLDTKLAAKAEFNKVGGTDGDMLILRNEGGVNVVKQENLDDKLRWVIHGD